jgi:ribose transport system substrate-binding protein
MEPDDCTPAPTGTAGAAGAAGAAGVAGAASSLVCDTLNASLQYELLQQAIDAKMDVIAISSINPTCHTPLIDAAVDAGIKVITWDSDAPNSKRHTYYGMDNEAAAHEAVKQLAALVGGAGKVAIQTSMSKDANGVLQPSASSTYVSRMKGITDELANYPDIQLVTTIPCAGNAVTDSTCAAEVEKVLTANPDLKGFIFSRGKILREVDLPTKAPLFTAAVAAGTIHSVAFDVPDDAIANFKAGYADYAIAQKQFAWGYDVILLGYDMVAIDRAVTSFTDSGYYVVCPSNVDQYAGMWTAKDFRSELAACP